MFLGKNIEYLIKQLKINQLEFARSMGVGQSTVSGWINNKSYPDFLTFLKIAKYLDVNLDDLVNIDLSNKTINSNILNQLNEPSNEYKTTEGVKIELLSTEREIYEKLLKEKDARIEDLKTINDFLKQNFKTT